MHVRLAKRLAKFLGTGLFAATTVLGTSAEAGSQYVHGSVCEPTTETVYPNSGYALTGYNKYGVHNGSTSAQFYYCALSLAASNSVDAIFTIYDRDANGEVKVKLCDSDETGYPNTNCQEVASGVGYVGKAFLQLSLTSTEPIKRLTVSLPPSTSAHGVSHLTTIELVH